MSFGARALATAWIIFAPCLITPCCSDSVPTIKPSGVVQKQQRRAALVAQLDKLRGLARALGRDGAVVADHADGAALDMQVAADGVGIELALEFKELGTVGHPRKISRTS